MSSTALLLRTTRPRRQTRTLVTKWQHAVSSIPIARILPLGNEADVAAFYGNKVLGAAVAAQQQSESERGATLASLTHLHFAATSNEMMRSHFPDVLPLVAADSEGWDARSAGIMLEAAVAAVQAEKDGGEAVADLARWLLHTARDEQHGLNSNGTSEETQDDAVRKLLELGGTVSAEHVGGTDDEPIFSAVAVLGEQRMMVRAKGTKESIEQRVSSRLLNSVFAVDY